VFPQGNRAARWVLDLSRIQDAPNTNKKVRFTEAFRQVAKLPDPTLPTPVRGTRKSQKRVKRPKLPLSTAQQKATVQENIMKNVEE